jgi:hypothetical protein
MVGSLTKTEDVGATNMGEETRRNFILAGSAQALFALQADMAFGQAVQTPPPQKEVLDRIIDRMQFRRTVDFYEVFRRLLDTRLDLSLATIAEDARTQLLDLAKKAQDTLQKEFGTDGPIPRENLRTVLAGTIFLQNIVFGVSTDAKSGVVRITSEKIQNFTQYYCSFYPYCK